MKNQKSPSKTLVLLAAASVALLATSLPTLASELLLNSSFDQGSNNWRQATSITNNLFATTGQVSLHVTGYTGNVIYQNLGMAGASNASVFVTLTLTRNASPAGSTVAAYLQYTDTAGLTNRLLLLRPDNASITNSTVVSTNLTLPADVQRLIRFDVDKELSGDFDLLAASLDVTPAWPAPYVYLNRPSDGDSFAAGANISLSAQVQNSGTVLSAVSFRANGTQIGIGQRDQLHGEWSFPPGDHMSIMAGTDEMIDYMSAASEFFAMDGSYPSSNHFVGTFTTWVSGAPVSGNVTIDFSFTAAGHLNASIQGAAPLGTRTLTEGTSAGQSALYTFTWTKAPAGLYGVTAVAIYGTGQESFGSPANITVTGVSPPEQPSLSIGLVSPTQVKLSWVSASDAFQPKSTADLRSPNWQSVPGTPVLVNGRWTLTVNVGSAPLFFRLVK
jgi:hypothetical protein